MALRRLPAPLLCPVLIVALQACGVPQAPETAAETFGCEANPTGDPIGGGEGYRDIRSGGDIIVTSAEELVRALAGAQPGQVLFIPDGTTLELTGRPTLRIPNGVTLAGTRGLQGSPGALVVRKDPGGTMLVTGGDGVRLTGLRFQGAEGGADRVAASCSFFSIGHYGAQVDNCEIFDFNVSGIGVSDAAMGVYIHHNYIHHCQKGGLGYGVSTNSSDVYIIANVFDYCRHHIASSGSPGAGYEAAWNLVLEHATSHHFDMHGGRDRGDSTNIAGDWLHIHHNTFRGTQRHVAIRGVPSFGAEVHHNWFAGPAEKQVVSGGNTRVYRNVYGPEKTPEE